MVDCRTLLDALTSGHRSGAALDVYEAEADLCLRDLSEQVLRDDFFARLLTVPNVLLPAHKGFLTTDALSAMAPATRPNLHSF